MDHILHLVHDCSGIRVAYAWESDPPMLFAPKFSSYRQNHWLLMAMVSPVVCAGHHLVPFYHLQSAVLAKLWVSVLI